jgi:hypothetical protein
MALRGSETQASAGDLRCRRGDDDLVSAKKRGATRTTTSLSQDTRHSVGELGEQWRFGDIEKRISPLDGFGHREEHGVGGPGFLERRFGAVTESGGRRS